MLVGEELIVCVEKMVNDGNSLARINSIPVFISGGCPDDKLKIRITKINKNYLTAEIVDIIEASKYRVKPECALYNACGSCNWQHISYEEQLNQKRQIVKESLNHIAGIDFDIQPAIASPLQKRYRCKIQLPVSQTKVSKRLLSGYYKRNSHELINIKYCPMQPVIINEITEFLKNEAQNLNITGYEEKKNKGLLRHIIYRVSSDLNQILIIFVINSTFIDKNLKQLSELLIKKYPQITGICANFNNKKTNVIMSNNTSVICGSDYYIEKLNNLEYQISANSFFQVNPKCAALIFDKVKELINDRIDKPSILDAYSGVSSFGIWLSDTASKVVCIEEVKSASSDAIQNTKLNEITNLEIRNGDAADELKNLINSGTKFDVSLIDPPRKGCSEEAINNLVNLTKKNIVYISCNPSTLARDIKSLTQKGFELKYVQPVDMFPHTYHVETIALLEKKQ